MNRLFIKLLAAGVAIALSCPAFAGQVTITGGYISAGPGQYALAVSGATLLTVPAGSEIAEICVETAGVRYRDDGVAPTSSNGIPVASGSCFQYGGPLNKIQFIAQSGSPTLDVSYYKTSE